MPKKTMTAEEFHDALHQIFDQIVEVVGFEEITERVERVDKLEEAISQTIDEQTADEDRPGTVLVALMTTLAERVVAMCIKEPPEVPAPVLSIEAVKNGLKMVNEAMASFASSAIREAETNGCTIAYRFRPKKRTEATNEAEDTPSDAPAAPGPLRDAEGATEGEPPSETAFSGTRASGTEG